MKDYFICIDVGKNQHWAMVTNPDGEIFVSPFPFSNDRKGYKVFYQAVDSYLKKDHLVGMEDTGHYGDNLRVSLLNHKATVAMINPVSTDAMRKATLKSVKTDKEDTKNIGIVLQNPYLYRIVRMSDLDSHPMRELTRYHHNMQEACTRYKVSWRCSRAHTPLVIPTFELCAAPSDPKARKAEVLLSQQSS